MLDMNEIFGPTEVTYNGKTFLVLKNMGNFLLVCEHGELFPFIPKVIPSPAFLKRIGEHVTIERKIENGN